MLNVFRLFKKKIKGSYLHPLYAEHEEQETFFVVLEDVGKNLVKVIRVVRRSTGLGLKESKELIDQAPIPVTEDYLTKEKAQQIVECLQKAGATVSMVRSD